MNSLSLKSILIIFILIFPSMACEKDDEAGLLTPDFEYELTSTEVPAKLGIENKSIGANTYSWSFVGGSVESSNAETPDTITYSTPGTYDIILEISNDNETKKIAKRFNVYAAGLRPF